MNKSILTIITIIYTLFLGCSSTTVYEDDNTELSNAGSTGISNTYTIGGSNNSSTTFNTNQQFSGNKNYDGNTSVNVGGSTNVNIGGNINIGGSSSVITNTNITTMIPETCLEAGERISGIPGHSACGSVIDKNGNELSCPTQCSNYLECGGAFWNAENQGVNIADLISGELGVQLKDRFNAESFTNVCGESCVDISSIINNSPCPAVSIICANNKTPNDCNLLIKNNDGKANVWCCNKTFYTKISKV